MGGFYTAILRPEPTLTDLERLQVSPMPLAVLMGVRFLEASRETVVASLWSATTSARPAKMSTAAP